MTLNHAARLLSAAMAFGGMLAFVTTGSFAMGLLVLAAPLPIRWVQNSDRQTWSLGEILRGERDDQTIPDALDQALRGPLPIRPVQDEDFFVPDCPRLDVPPITPQRPAAPPISTPLR